MVMRHEALPVAHIVCSGTGCGMGIVEPDTPPSTTLTPAATFSGANTAACANAFTNPFTTNPRTTTGDTASHPHSHAGTRTRAGPGAGTNGPDGSTVAPQHIGLGCDGQGGARQKR